MRTYDGHILVVLSLILALASGCDNFDGGLNLPIVPADAGVSDDVEDTGHDTGTNDTEPGDADSSDSDGDREDTAPDVADDTGTDAVDDPEDVEGTNPTVEFEPAVGLGAGAGGYRNGLLIQGDADAYGETRGDTVTFDTGAEIAPGFHTYGDANQGTIVGWFALEQNISTRQGRATLFDVSGIKVQLAPLSHDVIVTPFGQDPIVFEDALLDSWVDGRANLLAVRWDSRRALSLDGRHVALNINTYTFYGRALPWDASLPAVSAVGGDGDRTSAIGGVISGFTVYRRPIFDGQAGEPLGARDVYARMLYDGLPASDVTGSWDVVFALPTDQLASPVDAERGGRLAWSHPHDANLLGPAGTLPDAAAWNTPTGVSAAAAEAAVEETMFGQGMVTGSLRVRRNFDMAGIGSVVIRAIAGARTTAATGTMRVLGCNGQVRATVSKVMPIGTHHEFLLTLDTDADCNFMTVELYSSGVAVWHTVQVLPNLVTNPSLQVGFTQEGQYIPGNWTADFSSMEANTSRRASGHTGYGICIVSAEEQRANHLRFDGAELEEHGYYAAGGMFTWTSGGPPVIHVTNGTLFAQTEALSEQSKFSIEGATVADWTMLAGVGRRFRGERVFNNHNNIVRWGADRQATSLCFDDTWILPMAAVDLTISPADKMASTRDGSLRLDGEDRATQPAPEITGSAGSLTFEAAFVTRDDTPLGWLCDGGARLVFDLVNSVGHFTVRWDGTDLTWSGGRWEGGDVTGGASDLPWEDGIARPWHLGWDASATELSVDGMVFPTSVDMSWVDEDPVTLLFGEPGCTVLDIGAEGATFFPLR